MKKCRNRGHMLPHKLKSLHAQRIKHRLVDMTEWPDESTSIHHSGLCLVAYVPAGGLDYPPADGYHLLLHLLLECCLCAFGQFQMFAALPFQSRQASSNTFTRVKNNVTAGFGIGRCIINTYILMLQGVTATPKFQVCHAVLCMHKAQIAVES